MEERDRSRIITCTGSAEQKWKKERSFLQHMQEKESLGKKQPEWGLNDGVILRESEWGNTQGQENDTIHKSPPVLKDLLRSEDRFLPSRLFNQLQDNLSSHSSQGLPCPLPSCHSWHSRPCFLLSVPGFSLMEIGWEHQMHPLAQWSLGALKAWPPSPPEVGGAAH